MAKLEYKLVGDFDHLLKEIDSKILSGSISATLEEQSYHEDFGIRCAVRVYERYSFFGGNRVSLNITLVGKDNNLFLSAITSGGSQAMFLKINTFGEESFLDKIKEIFDKY